MKKTITAFVLIFTGTFCAAQDYVPMVVEGACWEIWESDEFAFPPYYGYAFTMEITGDTTFNNHIYKGINGGEYGYLREDTVEQKVYYFSDSENDSSPDIFAQVFSCGDNYSEMMLFDFDVEVGDTVLQCADSSFYYVIDNIDTIVTNPPLLYGNAIFGLDTLQRYFVEYIEASGNSEGWDVITEGVGASGVGPFFSLISVSGGPYPGTRYYKRDCDFQYISSTKEVLPYDFSVQPNPAAHIVNLEIKNAAHFQSILIYNSVGQLQKEVTFSTRIDIGDLPRGLYFLTLMNKKGQMTAAKKLLKE